MAQKTVLVPEIGELVLSKRKGSKHIRLSISAAGKVRVGMPVWVPYSAAISFAKSRADWINKHRSSHQVAPLQHGASVGKSYRLQYINNPHQAKTTTRILPGEVRVTSNWPQHHPEVQRLALQAAERALKKEAEKLLPLRLAELAARHNFSYKAIRVKKLSSRWGSCASDKVITLNYFLMQLPWGLIDYVLLHELIHTVHLNHSAKFWDDFERVYPNAKQFRKQIKSYRPIINSPSPLVA